MCEQRKSLEVGMQIGAVALEGTTVRLEPLTTEHSGPLSKAGLDPALWRWIPTPVTSSAEMNAYVATALDERLRGLSLPFAIVDRASGDVIGSTRFANIERVHYRLEIGWTWIVSAFQRSAANTEAKLLLLTHAFEAANANRVEFKTDALNHTSRRAIVRLGAIQEGTFRNHMVTASGRIRDTVYFSIIASEWPVVKSQLQARLER